MKRSRRTIQLRGFDYAAPGAYFVTLVSQRRESIFGTIEDSAVYLNALGALVEEEWKRSAAIRPDIELDLFVVMPNHLHAIVWIGDGDAPESQAQQARAAGARGAPLRRAPRSLGSVVAGFKSATTRMAIEAQLTTEPTIWQRNYFERVIRDRDELRRIQQYVLDNPVRWSDDPNHP